MQAKEICFLVTRRSAQLIAAAIIGILRHIEHHKPQQNKETKEEGPVKHIVAVDGGVFAHFGLYRDLLCEAVKDIAGNDLATRFHLNRTEGGAGFGAAALAAASYKYDKAMGKIQDSNPPLRKFPPRRSNSGPPKALTSEKNHDSDVEENPALLARWNLFWQSIQVERSVIVVMEYTTQQ